MEWKEVLLSEFLEFNPKRTIKKNEVARKITMDLLIPHSKQIYSFKYEPYTGGAKFSNGDTIMARITPCLENGKHAYVSCLNEGEIAYGSTEYIVLCGKNGVSDNEFVYYLSHTPQFVNTAIKSMVGSSGRQRAQVPVLENLIMPVPVNLSDQRKIAGILSALDSKIENNNKINANLEAQAEALFKSWFVDFTPFKDQPFVDSELGPIPQGWKVGKLGDIALQSTEKVLTRNDVKVLSPITTGKLVLSEEYFTKQVFSKSIRNYKIVKQGAFAYNPARVNIGSLGMNEFKFDGCVSPVYVVFECLKGYSFFFDLLRKTEFFKQAVISFAIGGVRQTLNYSDFALIDVTIPPQNIVQSFNEIYLHLKKKISINEEENQRLAALRDTLLPKLMSGEIKL